MNKGLSAASGDYVIFINSGDRLSDKDVIFKIINAIGNDSPDVVYGNYRECKGDMSLSKVIPCRDSRKIWYGMIASHQSILYRLHHLHIYNLSYDESYKIAGDFKLTAQAVQKANSILRTNICISDFDVSGVSSTNKNAGLAEANRVRREVFNWGSLRIAILSSILLLARYTKRYAYPVYKLVRN